MSFNELRRRWARDFPVPWDASNPLGEEAIEVAQPEDTPLGWVCFRHVRDGTLAAVIPGTRYAQALRAVRLADDTGWAYEQVPLPTPRDEP